MRLGQPPERTCSPAMAAKLLGYRSPSMVHKRLADDTDPLSGYRSEQGRWLVDLELVERLAAARSVLTDPVPVRGTGSAESSEHPLEFSLRFAESRALAAERELAAERLSRLEERLARLESLLSDREAELERARAQIATLGETVAALTRSRRGSG